MSELEVLVGHIDGLKQLLRIARKDLANPLLTPFERREARNQINQYSLELRRHIQLIQAERFRSSTNSSAGRNFAEPSLGFIPRPADKKAVR